MLKTNDIKIAINTDLSKNNFRQTIEFLKYRKVDFIIIQNPFLTLKQLLKRHKNGKITLRNAINSVIAGNILHLRSSPWAYIDYYKNRLYQNMSNIEGGINNKIFRINYLKNIIKKNNQTKLIVVNNANSEKIPYLLKKYNIDLQFICGGKILKKHILYATLSCTVHHSVLPKLGGFGGGEIWSLVNKDLSSLGVTVFKTNEGVDTGDIIIQKKLKINKGDDLDKLVFRNRLLGARLMSDTCDMLESGNLILKKQNEDERTIIRKLPSDAQIKIGLDWLETIN
jgi:folate-dependent phosphoribosylglycinamide formyltransferase PurN